MWLSVKQKLLICLFIFPPSLLFSKPQDTVVDSHYTWAELQQKLVAYYGDEEKSKLSGYQKEKVVQWITTKLSLVNVVYIGYDNRIHAGQVVCDRSVAGEITQIFGGLLQMRFPVYQCKPVSEFDFTDKASMQANNTSGFDFRLKTGSRAMSKHAYGLAIDINPLQNPYQKGAEILPYNNNETISTGRVRITEEQGRKVISIFRKQGWIWGGSWRSLKDYMHFEKR